MRWLNVVVELELGPALSLPTAIPRIPFLTCSYAVRRLPTSAMSGQRPAEQRRNRSSVAPGDVVAAAGVADDQALAFERSHRVLGCVVGDPVLLHQRADGRDLAHTVELAGLDSRAHFTGYAQVDTWVAWVAVHVLDGSPLPGTTLGDRAR